MEKQCKLLFVCIFVLMFVRMLYVYVFFLLCFFLMKRRPPRSTQSRSSAASDVYKRQGLGRSAQQ